ncbi:hypothetical protein GUJ93_ZPchr0003g16449 [Zizania palustris]|uniref:Uncharacterized protein n=1 Tax=Zizania palustris TaxID=103762 RepID=A0A8J5VIG2_ZIZPA|nr:hypothetical protein GUJ93_ZPchr0003g16449 [Zizania palustris]
MAAAQDAVDDDVGEGGAAYGGGKGERRGEEALDHDTRLSRASSPRDAGQWLRSSYPWSVVSDEVIPLCRRLDTLKWKVVAKPITNDGVETTIWKHSNAQWVEATLAATLVDQFHPEKNRFTGLSILKEIDSGNLVITKSDQNDGYSFKMFTEAMVSNFVENNCFIEIVELCQDMHRVGMAMNEVTLMVMAGVAIVLGEFAFCRNIHVYALKWGWEEIWTETCPAWQIQRRVPIVRRPRLAPASSASSVPRPRAKSRPPSPSGSLD